MFWKTITNFATFQRLNLLRTFAGGAGQPSPLSLSMATNRPSNGPNSWIKFAQPLSSSQSSSTMVIGHVQAYQFHSNNNSILAMANKQQTADNKKTEPNKSNKKTMDQKDQFIHDHLNSSQDFNQNLDDHIPFEQELVKEPPRERFGVLKAIMIIIAGIYFGSYVAMVGAKLLEDLDIFVKERDDDDD